MAQDNGNTERYVRKLNSLVSTHRGLRRWDNEIHKLYDPLGWETAVEFNPITRRGTRKRVQDIVSANGNIGATCPLASTKLKRL